MINKKSGTIYFKSLDAFLSPSIKQKDFLVSPIGKRANLFVKNKEYVSYKAKPEEFEGIEYIPLFCFKNEELIEIQLHNFTESSSWDDFDDSVLRIAKNQNDSLLKASLGHQPFRFSWGEVISFVDKKAGSVGIIIRYKNMV